MACSASREICAICLNLDEDNLLRDYRCKPRSVYEVDNASKLGCEGCKVIGWILEPYAERLVGEGHQGKFVAVIIKQSILRFAGHNNEIALIEQNRLALVALFAVPKNPNALSEFVRQEACPWPTLTLKAPAVTKNGSTHTIARVSSWLNECCSTHVECGSGTPSYLPTRILRLEGPTEVKLYESNNELGLYACLSHCWGGRTMIQTTSATLSSHLNGIPWQNLPPTFQDALQFTYNLGLKYLWIDSLCILQDSDDDWRHEGSKMSGIYAGSYITLAAAKAANAYEGCFSTLAGPYLSRINTFYNQCNEQYELHCIERTDPSSMQYSHALNKRAWTFQEQLLPIRVLYLESRGLTWDCHGAEKIEDLYNSTGKIDLHSTERVSLLKTLRDCQSTAHAAESWEKIVEIYKRRQLTYPSDIFPALQGIAKRMTPAMGRYLAGHWENHLAFAWYARPLDNDMKEKGGIEWRAPTWSWASAIGPVGFYSLSTISVQLMDAHTVPKGNDPTGQLSYGEIVLRGWYLRGLLVQKEHWREHWREPEISLAAPDGLKDRIDGLGPFRVYWDYSFSDPLGPLHSIPRVVEQDSDGDSPISWSMCGHAVPGTRESHTDLADMQVIAMKLGQWARSQSVELCLVLKAIDLQACRYQRIGLLHMTTVYSSWLKEIGSQHSQLNKLCGTSANEIVVTVI